MFREIIRGYLQLAGYYGFYFVIKHILFLNLKGNVDWDSSVGIVTGYELDGPGIESRWGARFPAPVQTGPGAHTASCTMATGPYPGVKSGRGVTLAPSPPSSAVIKKE